MRKFTLFVLTSKFLTDLVKTTFLGEVKASLRLGIKVWVNVWPSISDSILGLWFYF